MQPEVLPAKLRPVFRFPIDMFVAAVLGTACMGTATLCAYEFEMAMDDVAAATAPELVLPQAEESLAVRVRGVSQDDDVRVWNGWDADNYTFNLFSYPSHGETRFRDLVIGDGTGRELVTAVVTTKDDTFSVVGTSTFSGPILVEGMDVVREIGLLKERCR